MTEGRGIKQKNYGGFHYENQVQQTVRYHLIVAAVTCCGALGVFAADDANADTAAATTASETVNTDNDHNSSLSIGLVAAAWLRVLPVSAAAWPSPPLRLPLSQPTARTKRTFGKSLIFVALGESIALYGLVISIMILSSWCNAMRFFLISDNSDAMNGLRLAGIEGTVARSEADLRNALEMEPSSPTSPCCS